MKTTEKPVSIDASLARAKRHAVDRWENEGGLVPPTEDRHRSLVTGVSPAVTGEAASRRDVSTPVERVDGELAIVPGC